MGADAANRTVLENTFTHTIERAKKHLETGVSLLTAQQLTRHHQERDLYILEPILLATGLLTAAMHVSLKKGVFIGYTGSKNLKVVENCITRLATFFLLELDDQALGNMLDEADETWKSFLV